VPGFFVDNCTLRIRHGLLKAEQEHALAQDVFSDRRGRISGLTLIVA